MMGLHVPALDLARRLRGDSARQTLRNTGTLLRDEAAALAKGFLEHPWPAQVFMIALAAAATALSGLSAMLAIVALLYADLTILVLLYATWVGMFAFAAWSTLRSFARFEARSRTFALACVGAGLVGFAAAWFTSGRVVWIGLAGLSWVVLGVQLVVYLVREGERFGG